MSNFPPGFPYRTVAISPEPTPPYPSDIQVKWAEINAEVSSLEQQGKTDGVREEAPDQDPTTYQIHRYWIDEATANNWVGYINTIGIPINSIYVETAPT